MTYSLNRGDFWSGLTLAGLGAYILSEARGWDYLGPEGPGPGFFPLWYGLAMVVLSLFLVARSVLAKRTDAPSEPASWADIRRALTCWSALVVSVALLKIAGFVVSFALLSWFIVAVMFRRSQVQAWAIAIGGTALFYLLFDLALGLELPSGVWRL